MDHEDVLIRQGDSGIQRGDAGIVPLGDVAEEDVREGRSVQLQRRIARQVVDDHAAPATVGMCRILPGALARSSSFIGPSDAPKSHRSENLRSGRRRNRWTGS